jgi:ATP-binding cassette subfamily B protein
MILIRAVLATTGKIISYTETALYDLFTTESYEDIMRKISNLNLEDVENKTVQTLISSVPAYSIDATWNTFVYSTELINNMLTFISVGWIVMTQMSPWAILVALFVLPEAIYRYRKNRQLKEYRDENAQKKLYMDYVYQQATFLNNFSELRVDNVFKFLIDSFDTNSSAYDKGQNRIRVERDKKAGILAFIDRLFLRIIQIFLIPISISLKYTIGKFKYLFDYLEKLYATSWYCVWKTLLIRENSYYIQDYFDLLEYKGFGDIVSGKQKLDTLEVPSIEFINVDFSYPESKSAILENVSFKIEPGEKVAFVGEDESGKSTIAKLICGLYRIGPGDILINDVSVRNLDRGELKDKVSVVFEDYVKYDFSIRKNITLSEPEREFRRRRFEEALEITGLDNWMRENDFDENQIIGKALGEGIQISSGHWQRIAIARALYRDRHILILDESLTQVDGPSTEKILSNIIKHRPKQTLIYITQDKHNLELFDKIINISKGKIDNIEEK